MMTVSEYAIDVNKNEAEILGLCKKININVFDASSYLSEDDIILLDNELQNGNNEDVIEEDEYDEVLDEKVEKIVAENNFNNISGVRKEKLKSKAEIKEENNEFNKERKEIYKHRDKLQSNNENANEDIILYKKGMTVNDLAILLNATAVTLVKKLMDLGIMTSINNQINFEEAELITLDYGKTLKEEETADISNFEQYEINEDTKDLIIRPPVVTIMGHVDHGKTSLLDTIRNTNVVNSEAGGITQAIGAYQVNYKDELITFIDTPGHAAFTAMRARGASVTDIVIIIVAADDGVMPQTIEAIDHAKAAKVPIIVAINKIDKPNADINRVLTELAKYNLTPEEWGGDTIICRVSAKTGEGIDNLLENILLVASMGEFKANPLRYAIGTVLESRVDKQIGSIATLLVQNGTLRLGDPIVVGTTVGKVRTLKNDKNQNITQALPSMPVEVTGLSGVPAAGDKFMTFETEKQAHIISEQRSLRAKEKDSNRTGMTFDELFSQIKSGVKEVNVILKADVNGSVEAVKNSLEKIAVDGVKINVIRSSVGTITESDILLANASKAIIIGFNVRPNNKTFDMAKEYNVEIRLYDIIYKAIEEMEKAMKGMLEPTYTEKTIGQVEIRQLFRFSKVGLIAGCHVTNGVIKSNSLCRLIRDGIVIYTGKLKSLQREKEQVKEVKKDMDCGITLENYQDIKEHDIIECYESTEVNSNE